MAVEVVGVVDLALVIQWPLLYDATVESSGGVERMVMRMKKKKMSKMLTK